MRRGIWSAWRAMLLAGLLLGPAPLMAAEGTLAGLRTDPLLAGRQFVLDSFETVRDWNRVRRFMLDRENRNSPEVWPWTLWAAHLRKLPPAARLRSINARVNAAFTYESDRKVWGRPDYWATPRESIARGRMDCEDYASLKFYLAAIAGIDARHMGLLVGRIPSTGEYHVVLLVRLGAKGYVLDNRRPGILPSAAYTDFARRYAVNLEHLYIYREVLPRAAQPAAAVGAGLPISALAPVPAD